MKKLKIFFVILGVLVVSGYLLIRYFLTPANTSSAPPVDNTKPAASVLDLRPKLIVRLQQLVKQGSEGLYNLSVEEINPDIVASTISLKNITLSPDTVFLNRLNLSGQPHADIFKIKADSISITGIGIKDLLEKDVIDLKTVYINAPIIEIFGSAKKKTDTSSLYHRLLGQLKHFAADKIIINNATVINHNAAKNKLTKFHDIQINLTGLLIDSTTQFDKNRFLFCKEAILSMQNFSLPSKDGLYDLKIGAVKIIATSRLLSAQNISFQPRFNKKDFGKKTKVMQERFGLSFSSVQLKNTDWWALANEENIIANEAEINNGNFNVYLDRSLPQGKTRVGKYPHQILMKLPIKINIAKLNARHIKFSYEEFNPASGKTGKLFIDDMNGTVSNLTNMPSAIKQNPKTTVVASGIFMHEAPTDLKLVFDMNKYKTGNFSSTIKIKGKELDGKILNPLAEAVGLFRIQTGTIKELSAEVNGNNNAASGKVLFLYNDLKIAALEKDSDKPTGLDKKDFTSFVANAFLVKKQNPNGNKAPRNPDCNFTRDPYGSFFNLIWKTTFTGILKTTGLPQKLATKK